MISTNISEDSLLSDLYDLRYEIEEAKTLDASFMVPEQVLQFDSIVRYFSSRYHLNERYEKAIFEMKLNIYRQKGFKEIQIRLLQELRRLVLDINYLLFPR